MKRGVEGYHQDDCKYEQQEALYLDNFLLTIMMTTESITSCCVHDILISSTIHSLLVDLLDGGQGHILLLHDEE